ncbi:MAG: hypothetical protein QF568_05115 [Flavobacteriales bacterium]|jgi:hypothetical protein|nr:hypothetical protein [Flavobacteriales bacterium]|tara:strand:+ start:886 stop:1248 length:363 start_codon:yes stop_codon:yes gene_type:complete
MGVKLILSILFVIGLFLIVSCTSEPKVEPSVPTIYIAGAVEEPQVKTFVVGEENSLSWIEETKEKRHELNMIRYSEEYEDELEEFELKSRLKNVRRSVDNELIVGFDDELDNPRWKEVGS